MTFPAESDYQLFLLPAHTAAEASAWGTVAMEYAAAFRTVHFARDPATVDWSGYQHVTIVRPAFWPPDLPLIIKQANPQAGIDRIPVDSPEALRLVLNVRVFYGWRYGPQTSFDWSKLWPPGVSLIGLHGRADGNLQDADYAVIQRARVEAVKLTSQAGPETVQRLRSLNPDLFILLRPIVSFWQANRPVPPISPATFYEYTWRDVAKHYDVDPGIRYIEIHNEPNTRFEGLGGTWSSGREFGQWFLEVMRLYRQRFPDAKFGFPGLSPGKKTSNEQGRVDPQVFLADALSAAQQADWVGVHAYWTNELEMADTALGLNVTHYRDLFPEKMLFITEFGNPAQSRLEVAAQYARYYGMLRHLDGLGAAFAYLVSTPDPAESARWAWRDEAGNDTGIADVVGARTYIQP
jgi:hypothetical protein